MTSRSKPSRRLQQGGNWLVITEHAAIYKIWIVWFDIFAQEKAKFAVNFPGSFLTLASRREDSREKPGSCIFISQISLPATTGSRNSILKCCHMRSVLEARAHAHEHTRVHQVIEEKKPCHLSGPTQIWKKAITLTQMRWQLGIFRVFEGCFWCTSQPCLENNNVWFETASRHIASGCNK